ncbi:MAG: hypothetical protein ACI8RZ_005231 [Myxococcota bacterium]|jgi:hypothetical protein
MILIFLAGCLTGIDPEDCDYFSPRVCQLYTPQGTTCGLAHRDLGHLGASCQSQYDPALTFREGAIAEVAEGHTTEGRCPQGFIDESVLDEDIDDHWWFCAGEDNAETSSADLGELPAGVVCGLSKPRTGEGATCMNIDPTTGQCPNGFRFRWIVERGVLGEDETCQSTGEGEGFSGSGIVRVLTFCELTEETGCLEDGRPCPPERDNAGLLCGLHIRTPTGERPLDLTVDDISFSEVSISALDYVESCAPYRPYFTETLLQAMRDSAMQNLQPTCKGADISSGHCPGDLDLICTGDSYGNADNAIQSTNTLCWCGELGDSQSLP